MLNVEAAQIPGGLVDLVARWQRAERAWQQAQDDIGQVYEPEGLWEERHELFEALLAYQWEASTPNINEQTGTTTFELKGKLPEVTP